MRYLGASDEWGRWIHTFEVIYVIDHDNWHNIYGCDGIFGHPLGMNVAFSDITALIIISGGNSDLHFGLFCVISVHYDNFDWF